MSKALTSNTPYCPNTLSPTGRHTHPHIATYLLSHIAHSSIFLRPLYPPCPRTSHTATHQHLPSLIFCSVGTPLRPYQGGPAADLQYPILPQQSDTSAYPIRQRSGCNTTPPPALMPPSLPPNATFSYTSAVPTAGQHPLRNMVSLQHPHSSYPSLPPAATHALPHIVTNGAHAPLHHPSLPDTVPCRSFPAPAVDSCPWTLPLNLDRNEISVGSSRVGSGEVGPGRVGSGQAFILKTL